MQTTCRICHGACKCYIGRGEPHPDSSTLARGLPSLPLDARKRIAVATEKARQDFERSTGVCCPGCLSSVMTEAQRQNLATKVGEALDEQVKIWTERAKVKFAKPEVQ